MKTPTEQSRSRGPVDCDAERVFRILHVVSHRAKGGAETHLAYLASTLAHRGHDVHVAFLYPGPGAPPQDTPGLTFHSLRPRRNHDPRLLVDLIRLIRRVRPQIVQTWTPQMDVLAGLAGCLTHTAWVLSEQGCGVGWKNPVKRFLRRSLAHRARAIAANSLGARNYWARCCPGVPGFQVPNGIPVDRIERVALGRDTSTGFSLRDPMLVFYAGRLVSVKNLPPLIDAMQIIRRSLPAHLWVCGDGPQRGDLERRAEGLGVSPYVQFLGRVEPEAVWAHMKRAAVCVNLSESEGCPNTVCEAMVCRCPLLVSDIPAHREFLDESSACFVDASSPPGIARAIREILEDPCGARGRAAAAHRMVARLTIDTMVDTYENLYRRVLDSGVNRSVAVPMTGSLD